MSRVMCTAGFAAPSIVKKCSDWQIVWIQPHVKWVDTPDLLLRKLKWYYMTINANGVYRYFSFDHYVGSQFFQFLWGFWTRITMQRFMLVIDIVMIDKLVQQQKCISFRVTVGYIGITIHSVYRFTRYSDLIGISVYSTSYTSAYYYTSAILLWLVLQTVTYWQNNTLIFDPECYKIWSNVADSNRLV